MFDEAIKEIAFIDIDNKISLKATIHSNDEEVEIPIIETLDIDRDFHNKKTDYLVITIILDDNIFREKVWKYRDDLTLSLEYGNLSTEIRKDYKAIILDYDVSKTEQRQSSIDITKVKLQLVNPTFLLLKDQIVNNVFRDQTVSDMVLEIMNESLTDIDDLYTSLTYEVSMVRSVNERVYKQIILPPISVTDVVDWTQDRLGIYNSRANIFVDFNKLYIYPTIMVDSENEVHIYAVDDNFPKVNKCNHIYKDGLLRILVTRTGSNNDDNSRLMDGDKIEITDTYSIMKRPFQIAPDKMKIKKEYTTHTSKIEDSSNKTGKVLSNKSNNLYKSRGEILLSAMKLVTVEWNYSNIALIKPDSKVYYYVREGNEIKVYQGQILKTQSVIDGRAKIEKSIIVMALRRKDD